MNATKKSNLPRTLKIYDIAKNNKRAPWISLSGKWLEELGFTIGQKIKITPRDQLLVIEIIPLEEEDHKKHLEAIKNQLKRLIK